MKYRTASSEELVRLCVDDGSADCWEEFVRRFHRVLAAVVYRIAVRWGDPQTSDVDEVLQEVYLKLSTNGGRALRQFTAYREGSVHAYLKVAAANAAHDYFKAKNAARRSVLQTSSLEGVTERMTSDLGLAWTQIERNLLFESIDRMLAPMGRDRQIFWLYYRHGMSARAIASVPAFGLSVKGVESVLHRLTEVVRSEVGRQ